MAENTQKNGRKVPEFLREPLEAAQARLEAFEEEAQKVLKDLMEKGKASRKDFAELVQRLSKQDWSLDEMRGRLDKLREQGVERAHELRAQADSFRVEAFERLVDMQSKAVSFLGVASREQVEDLAREIERLVKRIENTERSRGAKKGQKRPAAEV
jgi:polyhydroxyalkanoate synthesis regulator phasin